MYTYIYICTTFIFPSSTHGREVLPSSASCGKLWPLMCAIRPFHTRVGAVICMYRAYKVQHSPCSPTHPRRYTPHRRNRGGSYTAPPLHTSGVNWGRKPVETWNIVAQPLGEPNWEVVDICKGLLHCRMCLQGFVCAHNMQGGGGGGGASRPTGVPNTAPHLGWWWGGGCITPCVNLA